MYIIRNTEAITSNRYNITKYHNVSVCRVFWSRLLKNKRHLNKKTQEERKKEKEKKKETRRLKGKRKEYKERKRRNVICFLNREYRLFIDHAT